MTWASLGTPGGVLDFPVINVSTATISAYSVVVYGTAFGAAYTFSGYSDPSAGVGFLPVVPCTRAAETAVFGIVQSNIPPGVSGLARRHGFSFARVAGGTVDMGDACDTSATAGLVRRTTGALKVYMKAALTATRTFTFAGYNPIYFQENHAWGFWDSLGGGTTSPAQG